MKSGTSLGRIQRKGDNKLKCKEKDEKENKSVRAGSEKAATSLQRLGYFCPTLFLCAGRVSEGQKTCHQCSLRHQATTLKLSS